MKKLITLTVLLAVTAPGFCQELSSEASAKLKSDYMKRSKHQAVAGWILAGAGSTLLLGTFLLQSTEEAHVSIWDGSYYEYESETNYAPAYIAGAVMLGGGIGFIVASSHNRNKAKALAINLNMETSKQVKNLAFNTVAYPALNIKFSF